MADANKYDFFLSRRGSVAVIAREVADALRGEGYKVFVQDYDIPLGTSFVEAMHEAIKNARDLIVLYTADYESSRHTRKEFTSFEAERAQSAEMRRIVVLRCEDVPLRGLLADSVFQDLIGVDDAGERRRRILAAAEGQSQSQALPPRHFVGVPPRIASFTGRVDELGRLDAILAQDLPAAVVQSTGRAALRGLGGIGKTSLAIEYAHRFRNLYAGVWWCAAEVRTGLLTSLAALAVTLGAATADEADLEKAAKAALRRLAEQRATWLLVYDNVTSPDAIADLLPTGGARLLITSRFRDWMEWAEEVVLDILPHAEAVAFLQNRAGLADEAGAQTLTEALGALPLALNHAAAFCRRTQTSFADYAAKAASLIAAAPRGAAYPRSVAATFDLAITEAVKESRAAETLMAYLAQCAPERVPMTLVEGATEDETERLRALSALVEVSLVKPDPFEDGTPAVTVHRLVQAVAKTRGAASDDAATIIDRIAVRLAAVYPDDGYENPASWQRCAQLTPHLYIKSEAELAISSFGAEWAEIFNRVGRYLQGRAAYMAAETLLRNALWICQNRFGLEHQDTKSALNNLAVLLVDRGDLAGARLLSERALGVSERVFGADHPSTALMLNNLAALLEKQGDVSGARLLYERALAIYENSVGGEHSRTAMTLNNLGRLLIEQDDLSKARLLSERALTIYEKIHGSDHPFAAKSLGNLAIIHHRQGDLPSAKLLFERALAINEKALGAEHPSTMTSLANLAFLLAAQRDFVGAIALNERALSTEERVLGSEHPNTNRTRNNLARMLLAVGRLGEALSLSQIALGAHEKILGHSHPLSLAAADVSSEALAALGRGEEASALRARYCLEPASTLPPAPPSS